MKASGENDRGSTTVSEKARGGGLMRLRGLVRKEFLQVVRDPSSIGIAFLMPVVLLLLFGYGVSLDAEHVPIAVVVEQQQQDNRHEEGDSNTARVPHHLQKFLTHQAAQPHQSTS
ncbi:MAG: hypothetical protein P8Y91_10335, partial [Desulfuromonadales bacterium]